MMSVIDIFLILGAQPRIGLVQKEGELKRNRIWPVLFLSMNDKERCDEKVPSYTA